jgi:hypothetical protein
MTRDELLYRADRIVSNAAYYVETSDQCGVLGDLSAGLERIINGSSLPDLCERQLRSVESLRLLYAQLEQETARQGPDARRVEQLAADLEELAQGLATETEILTWRNVARAYVQTLADAAKVAIPVVGLLALAIILWELR